MEIKIKKLFPDAQIPRRMHESDAASDLYCRESFELKPGETRVCKLGIATQFDPAYVALIWSRSSFAAKGIDTLGGVIDAGYRGEWAVVLQNNSQTSLQVAAGDRIAQVIFQKKESPVLTEVAELEASDRGALGFGSTNNT